MANLSQKQLDEMAKQRKKIDGAYAKSDKIDITIGGRESLPQSKIISEIMGDKNTQLYKYSLPETVIYNFNDNSIPFVDPNEYPILNIKGKTSRKRQAKGYNLFLLKEIEHVLSKNMKGSNMNATLNFLVWVGLQALRGMNQSIDIRIHDETYADGVAVDSYIDIEKS